MGANTFYVYGVGKTAKDAFKQVVADAQYDYGHAGYTGTIAEKGSYVLAGRIGSRYVDRLEDFISLASEWWAGSYDSKTGQFKRKPNPPTKIPVAIRDQLAKAMEAYDDKWGPAVCFEIVGSKTSEIKKALGRKGAHGKVYVFCGWASS